MARQSFTAALAAALQDPALALAPANDEAHGSHLAISARVMDGLRRAYDNADRPAHPPLPVHAVTAAAAASAAPPVPHTVTLPFTPLYVGPRNAEAVFGQPWRWVLDFAKAHAVPVIALSTKGDTKRGKSMIPVPPLVEAIERFRAGPAPVDETASDRGEDELEKFRRLIGKTKKSGR